MIKIDTKFLMDRYGISQQGVRQWFYNNKKSLKNSDDVLIYIKIMDLKKGL